MELINRLIRQYSIAWVFCGNNTKEKIRLANELNKQLRQITNKQ